MLPFYIYYSMFGFQRVGDLIWAAADQRARGFLLGATAGRTTLGGEGLQHQDGSSHVVAATVPNCRPTIPAFAYELAVIIDHGMRAMMEGQADEFYYVTVMNENYAQPSLPAGAEEGIIRGLYRLRARAGGRAGADPAGRLGRDPARGDRRSGPAGDGLGRGRGGVQRHELQRARSRGARRRALEPAAPARRSRARAISRRCLPGRAPVIAATDYVRAYPQLIAPYVEGRFVALGTDGFGRSDTRAKLRSFFEVDRPQIVLAALAALAAEGRLDRKIMAAAIRRYGIDPERPASWTC